jgi:hypothetical protein
VLNVPLARKLVWTQPMKHLGNVGHVESCFYLIRDRVSIGAREVHSLRGMFHRVRKLFWAHPLVHLVEACFGPFRDSANLDAR